MEVWLITSPTRLRSDIVPIPLTVSVEVVSKPPGIDRGTLVDGIETWQTGVFVAVAVAVTVLVGVFVGVLVEGLVGVAVGEHGTPRCTRTSSMLQPVALPVLSVPM